MTKLPVDSPASELNTLESSRFDHEWRIASDRRAMLQNEIAKDVESSFRDELRSKLANPSNRMSDIAEWANQKLFSIGVAVESPKTGQACFFTVTKRSTVWVPNDHQTRGIAESRRPGEFLGLATMSASKCKSTINIDIDVLTPDKLRLKGTNDFNRFAAEGFGKRTSWLGQIR